MFFHVNYELYMCARDRFHTFKPSSYNSNFVLGHSYVFNIFTLMCHKFLHLLTHYFVIGAFPCVVCLFIVV